MDTETDIGNVIANWQTKLLQLDRRNPLLYFRNTRSSVEITGTSPDDLLERLQRTRTGLKFPYAEPRRRAAGLSEVEKGDGDHVVPGDLVTDVSPVPLQRHLLSLHRKDREWEEEQGVNVLYVALGFLHWVDADGETAKSPLLLVPVNLERDSPRDPWRLKLEDEDPQVNETLRYQLSTLTFDLPEFEHEIPSDYLKEISRRTSYKKDWRVESALALATFPFAKMAMWEDLGQMRREGTGHAVILALAGDKEVLRPSRDTVSHKFPAEEDLSAGRLDDLLPVKEQFAVLPADHSQLQAIELARRGGHLVIHGPPGTGKSQTIANIIATLLADGKRVLFVSEKTAALDVVKRRLGDCDLGCFCLDLHSHRARKASVYQQLRDALGAKRSGAATFPLEKLEAQRQLLNSVVRALHEKRFPLALSVFEVHGHLARDQALQRVDFALDNIESLSSEALDEIRVASARIARRRVEFEAHRTSPWRSLLATEPTVELADELRQKALTMRTALSEIQDRGNLETERLGLPRPETPSEVEVAGGIAERMAVCPGVPEAWLSQGVLDRLERLKDGFTAMQIDRRRLQECLDPLLGNELPLLDFNKLKTTLSISFQEEQRLKDSLGAEWGERLCPQPAACEHHLRDAIGQTRRLRQAALLLADTLLSKDRLDTLSRIQALAQRVRAALDISPVPDSWFQADGFTKIRVTSQQARDQLSELQAAEHQLFADFEENLLRQVSYEMLVRYRTDYQGFWRLIKRSYRADRRVLSGCLRRVRKLKVSEALAVIELALRVQSHREMWETSSTDYVSSFGSRFSGRTTNWDAIARAVTDTESWVRSWEWGLESARRCFSEAGRAVIEPLMRNFEVHLTEWEAHSLGGRGTEPNSDLSVRQRLLESGAEVVARLAQDSAPLWPHLRCPLATWKQVGDVLSWALQLTRIQAHELELTSALRKDFEGYYDGPDSDWHKISVALQWTRGLVALTGGSVSADLARQCRQPRPAEEYERQKERLLDAISKYRVRSADFSGTFDPRQLGWSNWEAPTFENFSAWLSWIDGHANSASSWLDYRKAVRDLERLLAPGAVDSLRDATDDALQVPSLILRRVYFAWIDHTHKIDARLRFQPRDHEALRAEFRKLDKHFVDANQARVRAQCFRRYPDDKSSAIEWGQLGVLNRQLSLKRPQMPIRRLIQQVPVLLQALKPCFLMSPVAVSQYLSRSELATDQLRFDAVVFDEASQVFPHDAVPAIARATQVIVVGDQKQLPPTSFFRSEMSEEKDEDEELPEDRLEGVESILDVMVGMKGAGVQEGYLGMHYRSRHEDLIRYSNHYFYEDRLLIFPSPDKAAGPLGLKDIYVPSGRYDAGASRTNREEAQVVVRRVFELMRSRPPNESVGVVALSRKQAELIDELINVYRLEDSSLDSRFSENLGERFFIKNLENVQGDERDHIILCIGYGPTVGSGSVPNRFGPINLEGGERRLNVAVTRARRSLTVIRSLRPEQITSESRGARLLRRFLEYVQEPVRAFEQIIDVDPAAETESPFEEAVYGSLTERGHRVSKQVGCFGYRIDLAICSEDGNRYDLGIECDGAAYHRAPAARDRDWLRQSVLEGLGWTIHRIWSTDWIRDPEAQIRLIEKALEAARTKTRDVAVQNIRVVSPAEALENASEPSGENDGDQPSEITGDLRFPAYKMTELPRNHKHVSVVEERPDTLIRLIEMIVETEGPIHIEVVIERIRRHYGAGRAGNLIQAAILRAAKSAPVGRLVWRTGGAGSDNRESSFLDVPSHPERPEPRGPSAEGSIRPIEYIWPGEIEAGVIRVIETAFGISPEEVVVAVARAFGYERAGWKIQEAIKKAVERLAASGEILQTSAGLTCSDESEPLPPTPGARSGQK